MSQREEPLVPWEVLPPQALEMEQAILACCLIDEAACDVAADVLTPHMFIRPAHCDIYDAIQTLHNDREPVMPLTVADLLRRRDLLEDCGGSMYLMELIDTVPTTASAAYYAERVEETHRLRSTIMACVSGAGRLQANPEDIPVALEQVVLDITKAASGLKYVERCVPLSEAIAKAQAQAEASALGLVPPGASVGLFHLTQHMGRLGPQTLTLLAGRTSMGKTSLALGSALATAREGGRVLIFSLEMSSVQLSDRLVSIASGVPLSAIRAGRVLPNELAAYQAASDELSKLPIVIDDTGGVSCADVARRSRRQHAKEPLALVVVDHVHLMRFEDTRDNDVRGLARIAYGLKALAKELVVPVLALAQLSRGPEGRPDKRPALSDLRASGGLEETADCVLLVYRPAYYAAKGNSTLIPTFETDAEVIVAKHRDGPTGSVTCRFEPRCAAYRDPADPFGEED